MKKAVSALLGVLKDKPIVANLLLLVIMMIQYYVAPRSWDLLLGDRDCGGDPGPRKGYTEDRMYSTEQRKLAIETYIKFDLS
ncbi:hypothetical protein, partial [Bifidobacterium thermophilum]|uniref:hypothetical protein n=1 Tax=Bifidobacterium thermophilum TaxID=33905 RepID=UPI003F8EDAC4